MILKVNAFKTTLFNRIALLTPFALLPLATLSGCGAASSGSGIDSQVNGTSNGSQVAVDHSSVTPPKDVLETATPVFQDQTSTSGRISDPGVNDDANSRNRYVKVDFNLLKKILFGKESATNLIFNFFDNVKIEITVDKVEKYSDANYVVTGRILGDADSAVTLAVNNETLVGNLQSSHTGSLFQIRYVGNGLHSISVPSSFAMLDVPCAEVENFSGVKSLSVDRPLLDPSKVTKEGTPIVDMLVAYTPSARRSEGGTDAMKALIELGIADTNAAFADSGVNLKVRLAGVLEVAQEETGNWAGDLKALESQTDGRWDEVHGERMRVNADQVTMIANYDSSPSTAGIGNYGSTFSTAFTVVRRLMFKQYTFSHELGHNLGLAHSDGYESPAGFRTIMAYGTSPRVRRYSNPSLFYNKAVSGTAYHNESGILNRLSATVSARP